jgi:arylsulfatase A-like enzyme
MNRLFILLITFAAVSTVMAKDSAAGKTASKPNILFFAVDDLRPEIACFGAKHIHSPNLDRLAERGTVFLNAHCQQAVCSPSRTSLMTGLRPDSTRVWDLETHFRDHVPDVVTVSQHFKDNGYHAVSMGKIYHGGYDDVLSWSETARKPAKGSSRYVLPENLKLIREKNKAARAKGLKGKTLSRASRGPATEMADVPDAKYTDGAIAVRAVETLRELKKKEEPFFLAVGFLNPHLPFNSPKKYWNLYDRDKIELAPNPFYPKNAYEKALSRNFGEIRVYEGIPEKGPIPDDQALTLKHGYYAAVSFIDACVGKVLNELEQLGLAENTVVVLWGDHGWKLGEHGAWCKHSNVRNDTYAPIILAAPGQKSPGGKTDAPVEFVDIYPTLCDLAGLDKPAHLEGDSFAPLLDKPDRPWKRAAFSQYPRGNIMGYSMTAENHRLTLWVERDNTEKVVFTELYDQNRDPQENENVAGNPEYASVLEKLTRWHREGWEGTRRAFRKR